MSRTTQGIIIAIAVVVAGASGLAVGRYLAARRMVEVAPAPYAVWHPGDTFPVMSLQTEWGDSVSTRTLLARGGVVLFVDLECPPCVAMAHKWDQAAKDGVLDPSQIVVVTAQPAGKIGPFRQQGHLDINVYRDPAQTFLANQWITSFPVEVIVDDAGRVVSVGDNPAKPIDERALQSALVMGQ